MNRRLTIVAAVLVGLAVAAWVVAPGPLRPSMSLGCTEPVEDRGSPPTGALAWVSNERGGTQTRFANDPELPRFGRVADQLHGRRVNCVGETVHHGARRCIRGSLRLAAELDQ